MDDRPVEFELTGIVAAEPERVWHLLVEARRRGDGDVTVDGDRGHVDVRGEWWYGGRDVVERHEQGTRITHQVVNLAGGPGRLVARAVQVRSHRRHARDDFAFLLGTLGQRLGCRTWVED